MKKRTLLLFAGWLIALMGGSTTTWANEMNYSVKALLPESQVNKQVSYFDLQVKPGQEETLTVQVTNEDKEPATIDVALNNALTNNNGVIDYTKHGVKPDPSMAVPLETLAKDAKQTVTFAGNETKNVTFHLKMPEKAFQGTVLGGLHFRKQDNTPKEKKKKVMIENMYSYVIGVQLREDLAPVAPEMVLQEVKPTLVNYRTAVNATLQNKTPTLLRKVSIDAKVTEKGQTEVLHQTKKGDMSVAPNTHFAFPISWDNQALQPGNYTLTMHVDSDQGQWEFKKDFTIKAKEIKKLNDEAVELQQPDRTLEYVLIGVIVLLVVGFLWFYWRHKQQEKKIMPDASSSEEQ